MKRQRGINNNWEVKQKGCHTETKGLCKDGGRNATPRRAVKEVQEIDQNMLRWHLDEVA
jgi:hypothetical protein